MTKNVYENCEIARRAGFNAGYRAVCNLFESAIPGLALRIAPGNPRAMKLLRQTVSALRRRQKIVAD